MKLTHLFPHFSDEQYKTLLEKHKTETGIKVFLSTIITSAVEKECELIKEEKLINNLEQVEKL